MDELMSDVITTYNKGKKVDGEIKIEKDNDLISIIIPVYNVEKYLEECIESIVKQTYKNIEIILVDDGSPDNCGNICNEYKKRDQRVKVIHKENGGLSDARNCGINIAKGKYICFVDSDDYVDKQYIEKLYKSIKEHNAKIVQCSILKVNNQKDIINKYGYDKSIIKSGKELIKEQYNKHVVENTVVWNKMYERELFDNIKFPIGKIHEDEFVTYKLLYNLDRVPVIDEYLYNYRQNQYSITNQKFNINKLDVLSAYKEKMDFFKTKEKDIFLKTLIRYIETVKDYYSKSKKEIKDSNYIEKSLLKEYRNLYRILIKQKEVSVKYKTKMLLFYISPRIYMSLKKKWSIKQ